MDAQLATRESEIWQLHLLGVPKTKIAERLGLHRNTISSIIKDLNEKGGTATTVTPETSVAPISDDAPPKRTTQEQFEAKPSKTGS